MGLRDICRELVGCAAALLMTGGTALAGEWQEQPHPDIADRQEILENIVAITPQDVWAVGRHWGFIGSILEFSTLIEHWDGLNWSLVASRNVEGTLSNYLQGVASRSATEVWAVGWSMGIGIQTQKTLVERWDGSAWSIVPSPNPGPTGNSLEAVAVIGDDAAWAVGSMYSTAVVSLPISMHWDGSVWTAVDVPVPPFCTQRTYLTDVAAARPKLVLATGYCTTAAGDQGFVLRWDGRAWSVAAGPDQIPAPSALNGLTFKSGTEAWAVGTAGGQAFILHWDGTAWAAVDAPADVGPDSSLTSIDSSRTRLWAVGLGQSSQPPFAGRLTARWDGTAWERVPAGDFGSFNGVSVVGNKTWAVGQNIDHSLIMWRRN
jgi:hypothetical protein